MQNATAGWAAERTRQALVTSDELSQSQETAAFADQSVTDLLPWVVTL